MSLTTPGAKCPLCGLELPGLLRCPDFRAYYPGHDDGDSNDCDLSGTLVVQETREGERAEVERIATEEFVQAWHNETMARSDSDAHAVHVLSRLVQFLQADKRELTSKVARLERRVRELDDRAEERSEETHS